MNYNFYHFVYYKLYSLAIKTEEKWNISMQMPEMVAAVSYSILLLLNIGFILLFLYNYLKIDIEVSSLSGVIAMIILYLLQYFIFIYKKKYLYIKKYFDEKNKKKQTFVFWLYIFISIMSYFIIWQ